MYILSCLCLSFVFVGCVLGAFSDKYDATISQRFGMGVLGLGCCARIGAIWAAQSVANDWFMVHGGMALIAIGTMWRYRYGVCYRESALEGGQV